MESQNTESQIAQSVTPQTSTVSPISQALPPERKSSRLKSPDDSFHSGSHTNGIRREKLPWIIIIILLVLVGIFGGYFVLNQTNNNSQAPAPGPDEKACTQEAKICPDGSGVGRTGPDCEFEACPTTSASPSANADTSNWRDQTITVNQKGAPLGDFNINIGLKTPANWTFATSKIAGCNNAKISNSNGFTMNLRIICDGWSAKYSDWPDNPVIVQTQNRMNNAGSATYYRLRLKNSSGGYEYVDADSKDKKMDAIMIGFPPPSEGTHDFYFNAANLTTSNGNESDLAIADKIAAFIAIKSLVQNK